VIYGDFAVDRGGCVVTRDPDTIPREIERARDALADDLDRLSERASPRRFVDQARENAQVRLADPRIRYSLIAVAALLAMILIRRLVR